MEYEDFHNKITELIFKYGSKLKAEQVQALVKFKRMIQKEDFED